MYSTPTGFPQSTSEKKTVVDWTQKDELFPDHKGAKCFILLRLFILVRLFGLVDIRLVLPKLLPHRHLIP